MDQATNLKDIICGRLCRFYRPDKPEQESCHGLAFLLQWSKTYPDLIDLLEKTSHPEPIGYPYTRLLDRILCRHCPFFTDGCDFVDARVTGPKVPCGGYLALVSLLHFNLIKEEDLLTAASYANSIN
ncbi:MAG: hypothetical protein HQK57_02600 [Deltaproteobacteria bacterium]|nr:hypothetical protein [Deltaproteobacteria bacterium]MBF0527054.1 hypothetical protein [Deltaproteobacteria bacterium]